MNIKLRRVNDHNEENTLPKGVCAVIINNEVYFVRRVGKQLIQLSEIEQKRLRKIHCHEY